MKKKSEIDLGYVFDAALEGERADYGSLEKPLACSTLLRRLWPGELAGLDTAKPSMKRERQASNGAIRYQYQLIDIAIKFRKDLSGHSQAFLQK